MAAPSVEKDVDIFLNFLSEFEETCPDPPYMRTLCKTCKRPARVCWCAYLPNPPLEVQTNVIILQHPYEEKRCLRTSPMLLHGLQHGKCHILKGRRFNLARYPILKAAVESPDTLLLFPGGDAKDITEIPHTVGSGSPAYTLILLDGTWTQARGIFKHNTFLHNIQQVQLKTEQVSEYVIRTQPMEGCLSTVETAAIALAHLEQNEALKKELAVPLRALCSFQLQHGAVTHHSKEYLIKNGLYMKQKPKEHNKPQDAEGS